MLQRKGCRAKTSKVVLSVSKRLGEPVLERQPQESTSVLQREVSTTAFPFQLEILINILDDEYRGPPRRYDDRRGGYGGGYRNDRGDNYRSRYDDRDRNSYRRDDYGSRGIDRYASSGRDDRYSSRTDRGDRGDRGYDRRDDYGRDGGRSNTGYGDPAPSRDARDPYGGRVYDDRNPDDRYSRR